MNSQHVIRLSGPFSVTDSLGRTWAIESIRIFDEGYGTIDVYIELADSMDDEPLYEDVLVIRQIQARLGELGYVGPALRPGDIDLQDERLMVLEAPEEFSQFAASKGWKNLADDYADEHADASGSSDATAHAIFSDLMRRLLSK